MEVAVMMLLPPILDSISSSILDKVFKALLEQKTGCRLRYIFIMDFGQDLNSMDVFLKGYFKDDEYELIPNFSTWGGKLDKIVASRNLALDCANGSDFGLFLDSDVVLPKHGIKSLVSRKKDIVGGVVKVPMINVKYGHVWRYGFGKVSSREGTGQIVASETLPVEFGVCGFVNTACMMLSRKILEDNRMRFCLVDDVSSEDHLFCYLALSLGYRIYIDPKVRCKHYRRIGGSHIEVLE